MNLDIIELYACILQIFVIISTFPINFLTSLGICSTPKLSKYITLLAIHIKNYPMSSFDLLHMPHPLF